MGEHLAILKDEVLKHISESSMGYIGHLTISDKLKVSEQVAEDVLDVLADVGLVRVYSEGNPDGVRYTMSKEGRLFVMYDSFLHKWKEERRNKLKISLKEWSTYVSALVAVFSTVLTYSVSTKNTDQSDIKIEVIDTIKQNVSRLKLTIDSLSKMNRPAKMVENTQTKANNTTATERTHSIIK